MRARHAVVDGSNIATEGRTEPSLKQLREAVAAFRDEYHFRNITVIVDASFEHRVAKSEQRAARRAIDGGEIITPPAGVVGRGDAFILEVADKADAVVLSNDSFQEFHGTYPWLFEDGRLIGGKPVPGVGWIYVDRTPVRGPVSRRATSEKAATKKPAKKSVKKAAAKKATRKKAAKKEAATPTTTAPSRHAGSNEEKDWRHFRHDYPVGTTIAATVDRFSSHGAYAHVDDVVVYLPNRLLGDPPPTKARDVIDVGETRDFVIHRYDDEHHGIDAGLIPAPDAPKSSRAAAKKTTKKATKKATKRAAKKATKKAPAKKATKKATKKGPAKKTTKKAARAPRKRSRS